jgi:acyl carrier protein
MTVEQIVLDVIEQELAIPRSRITSGELEFVRDLHMDSDDLSLLFIPQLESRLGVNIPAAEWLMAYSIGDVIDLLERHVRRKAGQ